MVPENCPLDAAGGTGGIQLRNDQILVLQVPIPEPLRIVEPKEEVTKKMHAEKDYAPIWLQLYESIVRTCLHKRIQVSFRQILLHTA